MMSDLPDLESTEPDALERFVTELRESGFTPEDKSLRRWSGSVPRVLRELTDAATMTIVLREGWPYRPPAVEVPGLRGWHADFERACLWQQGDTSLQWLTLSGIVERIDTWAVARHRGFGQQGAALDAWAYFDAPLRGTLGIDIAELSSILPPRPEQSGNFSVQGVQPGFFRAVPGWIEPSQPRGRWFATQPPEEPPRSLDEAALLLSKTHQGQLDRQLRLIASKRRAWAVVALVWDGPYGFEVLPITLEPDGHGSHSVGLLRPTPHSCEARLLRAGPDAQLLEETRITIFGLGSVGSHLASNLANSGCRFLTMIDGDTLLPANVVRHAAPSFFEGYPKVAAMKELLENRCPWTHCEALVETPWSIPRLREHLNGANLAIDATGDGAFTQHLAKVCTDLSMPLVSVALYRGGAVARVRRQAQADHPIALRGDHWRYPVIPRDVDDDSVGLEVGCTAPINNAPPIAVVAAARLAAHAAMDLLTGRLEEPDEAIEVLRPLPEVPFDNVGRVRQDQFPPCAYLTSEARAEILKKAAAAFPNETGGILIGLPTENGEPWITEAVELESDSPSPSSYRVPPGKTQKAVDQARRIDDRLGYLGEWHSHPNATGQSRRDKQTMLTLAESPALVGSAPLLIVARRIEGRYELACSRVESTSLRKVELRSAGPLPSQSPQNAEV